MKIDEDLTVIHAYLCADGYVIKNPQNQKTKYYKMGFRNTNLVLLKDFQDRFEKFFKVQPSLYVGQRCQKGSKEIYEFLTSNFGSFYSKDWNMPKINISLSKFWLRAYFDCEGWVFCKSHQNRHIGIDSINKKGLDQVEEALKKLKIASIRKYNSKRKIYRLMIYGKENIKKFSNDVGFLHPEKSEKLKKCLKDFVEYKWSFPKNKDECKKVIQEILNKKVRLQKSGHFKMFSREKRNLIQLRSLLNKFYKIKSLVYQRKNGIGTIYYELIINKKEGIQKLIRLESLLNLPTIKQNEL